MSFNMTFLPTIVICKWKKNNQMLSFNTYNHLTSFKTYKASSSKQKKKNYIKILITI